MQQTEEVNGCICNIAMQKVHIITEIHHGCLNYESNFKMIIVTY